MLDGSLERSSSFYAGIGRSGYSTSTPDPVRSRFPLAMGLQQQHQQPAYPQHPLPQPSEPNPIIVQQNVTAWFYNIKSNRQVNAAGYSALVSILFSAIFLYLVNLTSLKFSPSHLISWNLITVAAISGGCYFILANFLINYIFSVNYETYRNLKRLENAIIMGVWFGAHIVLALFLNLFMPTPFWYGSMSVSLLVFFSTLVSAYKVAYDSDFRLAFPMEQYSKKRFFLETLNVKKGSDMNERAWKAIHVFKWSWIFTVVLAILFGVFRATFLDLLNPSVLINVFAFVVYQQFMAYFIISLVKLNTMEPLKLQMPSPYFAAEAFLNKQPNLIHALTNDDALLKMFGLRGLRDMSMQDPKERMEVYTLSQPGGHPRNWNSIRDVCLSVVRQINARLEAENVAMQAGNTKFLASFGGGVEHANPAAFLPPSLRPKYPGAPGVPQSRPLPFLAAKLKPHVEWAQDWWFQDPPVITRYESTMAQYSIECIYMIAINAYKEDTYGVVQKDLAKIVTSLLDFEINTDTFLRAKNLNPQDKRSVASIKEIEHVLIEALCKLYIQYHEHIDSLNLAKDQLEMWEMLVSP